MLPCLCSRKSLSSISSMPCQSLRTSLVFLDLAINSFLSRTILVFNSVPLRHLPSSQSSPPCTRLDIYLNVFSTISSIHSNPSFVLRPSFPLFRRQFRQFLSTRLRQCTLVLRSYYF